MSTGIQLFFVFLKIGLFSIGGGYAVIPFIQERVVEQGGWITQRMFTDIITISQMTPGPLAVNTSTFVGLQIGGLGGAAAATLGCVICGIVISLLLYRFFQRHQGSACLFELLSGLKSASLGLIVSAAATILLLAFFGTSEVTPGAMVLDRAAGVIFLCALLAVRKWKLSPILVMLLSAAAGVIVYA